jgi:hypothetical protein
MMVQAGRLQDAAVMLGHLDSAMVDYTIHRNENLAWQEPERMPGRRGRTDAYPLPQQSTLARPIPYLAPRASRSTPTLPCSPAPAAPD